jgi:hypothetical protein
MFMFSFSCFRLSSISYGLYIIVGYLTCMLDLFMIVSSVLVAYCCQLSLIYVTRVHATIMLKSTCSSELKRALLNKSISI